MKVQIKYIILGFVLLPVLYFVLVMLFKEIPYFSFNKYTHFLATKPDEILDNPIYLPNFFIHISTSLIVIFLGIFQFIPYFIHKHKKIHRNFGKAYIIIILFLAAPTGFIIGLFANGGLSCKVGFCLQSIVWAFVTFLAFIKIKNKMIVPHMEWMIRSFAITCAAMSLRTESYILHYFFHTKPIETYLTVTWLSWVGNLIIAELIIQSRIPIKLLFLHIQKNKR